SWSKIIEEAGVPVRIYARPNSSALWYSIMTDGRKVRKTLKTSDRKLAEERARAIARAVAELQLVGGPPPDLRLGHLVKLYLHHRGPLLSDRRRRFQEVTTGLFLQHLGEAFQVTDLSQHHVDTFVAARR